MSQVTYQRVVLQVFSNLIYEDFDEQVSATKFDKFLLLYFTLLLVIFICYDISLLISYML